MVMLRFRYNSVVSPNFHLAALVHSLAVSSPTKENKDSVELDRTIEEELFLPEQDLAVPKLLNVDVRCNRNSLDVVMTFDAEFHGEFSNVVAERVMALRTSTDGFRIVDGSRENEVSYLNDASDDVCGFSRGYSNPSEKIKVFISRRF